MGEDIGGMRPVLRALLATVGAALGAVVLLETGLGPQASLTGGLILAGGLNILGLLSLNRDLAVPTSGRAVGENGP